MGGREQNNQVNGKRLGKQVLSIKIEGIAFVHFRREMMAMGCNESSYTKIVLLKMLLMSCFPWSLV